VCRFPRAGLQWLGSVRRVEAPDLIRGGFREPDAAVRAAILLRTGSDARRLRVRGGNGILGNCAGRGYPADLVGCAFGEKLSAVISLRNPIGRRVCGRDSKLRRGAARRHSSDFIDSGFGYPEVVIAAVDDSGRMA